MSKKEIKIILEEYIKLCELTIADYRKMIDNIDDPAAKMAFKTRIFQINSKKEEISNKFIGSGKLKNEYLR